MYHILVMKKMKTTRYELNINRPDLAEGTIKIAFLTDLHLCENGPGNETLLKEIREAEPDLILCGGDMLIGDKGIDTKAAEELLKKLSKEVPVYHGLGNHEARLKRYPHQYGPVYQEYKDILTKAGVVFLDNEAELICVHGIPVQITGYTLPQDCYTRVSREKIDASRIRQDIGEPDAKALNIMMAHHPEYMNAYRDWGADLSLCGHFHGGIIRLAGHTGLITPNVKIFNNKCWGIYSFDHRLVQGQDTACTAYSIVGAGLGEHHLPLRIHNPRELVIAEIHSNPAGE